eukprot:4604442-Alexandrium_andersonii.AAC.1
MPFFSDVGLRWASISVSDRRQSGRVHMPPACHQALRCDALAAPARPEQALAAQPARLRRRAR